MNLQPLLKRLEATHCPDCRGHGNVMGVFHRFPCLTCCEAGYVQLANQQPIDTLAAALVANAKQAAKQSRVSSADRGTPDNWILRNNFRGD